MIKLFSLLVGLGIWGANLKAETVSIETGKKVFTVNCATCHGDNGDGKGRAAVAIKAPKPRDFTKGEFKYGNSEKQLLKTITEGVPGTAMPAWTALSEIERKSVIKFILTLKK